MTSSPSGNDSAASAYDRFEGIVEAARDADSPAERYTLLSLALRSGLHPVLEPYRRDALLPLGSRFVSLDAQVAAIQAILEKEAEPSMSRGSVGGSLYLPASGAAVVCRVRCACLRSRGFGRWERPTAVHSVSDALHASAALAFEAALNLLLFVCPGDTPPAPSLVVWGVEGIDDAVLEVTAGDSLQLPLTLAFLSALTGLSVASDVGATGAIRPPDRLAPVGFVNEKRAAFLARYGHTARFLTPEEGWNVRDVAVMLGREWQTRFAAPVAGGSFSLPVSVTPTFVYAEIENAPVYWADFATQIRATLPNYEAMFADSVARHGGKVFRSRVATGETLGAVFADPAHAVDAAVHLMQCARAAIWDDVFGDSLPIRVGIHRGEGEPAGDAWRGAGPAGAQRIADAASAFQILASEAVHDPIAPSGWMNHGKHRLRDLSDAVILWQVTAPGIQAVNVPPESLDTRRHNLPLSASPLIGRETEIESLTGLLSSGRFITLIGAGGVGKTRLAIAAAAHALMAPKTSTRFPDGAFYVSLDEGRKDGEEITTAVCEAVGVAKITSLASKRLLLLLDNAEGAIDAVTALAKSLSTLAPDVVVLVTSRVPIQLRVFRRVRVAPLSLPKRDADEREWEQAPAVRLFLDRARMVGKGFAIATQADRDALTRLLRRLDGLPLAIELAAARTRLLSVSQIEDRLAESLRLLSTRDTEVPERQRTLLATLEWSYALLSESEQNLLKQISVFVGGFGADAAEGVTGDDLDTLDSLGVLEDHSLLVGHRADKGEPPRFSLLQTIADFVRGKLLEAGPVADSMREAHAHYFAALAQRNGGENITLSSREAEAFDALDRDMPNLRAAWSYLYEAGDTERLASLAANLSDFLRRRGHTRERFEWIETALGVVRDTDVRRRLLYAHAMTLRGTGRATEAEATAESLQSLVDHAADVTHRADAFALRGTIATRTKRYAEAEQFFDAAEALYRTAGNKRGMGTVYSNRAMNAMRMREEVRAEALLETALTYYDEIGDEQGKAYVHNNLGHLLSEKGEYARSKPHFLYQLDYCRRHADTMGCAVSLFNVGEAFLYLGERDGLPLMIAATEIFSRVGHPYVTSANSDCEAWREKTNTARSVFAALRRAASRRTLAELREALDGGRQSNLSV